MFMDARTRQRAGTQSSWQDTPLIIPVLGAKFQRAQSTCLREEAGAASNQTQNYFCREVKMPAATLPS